MPACLRWLFSGVCLLLGLVGWSATRLPAPAWEADGVVHVPVRALLTALGGTVTVGTQPATLAFTLNDLGGHYYLLRHRTTPGHARREKLWQRDGVCYLPLREVAGRLRLQVQWDASTREAVVTYGARTIIVPTRPLPPLRVAADGVHALINTESVSYVIGGTAHHRYLDGPGLAPQMLRHGHYRVYTMNAAVGTCRGTKPALDAQTGAAFLTITPPPRRATFALEASWHAQPRRPRHGNPTAMVYQQMARTVLLAHGLPDAPVHVRDAYTCDLDGDGHIEQIIFAASTPAASHHFDNAVVGDYVFVAVRQEGHTHLIAGDFVTTTPAPDFLDRCASAAFLDVDGDGRLEVIIAISGYEWGGAEVYRVTPRGVDYLYGCVWGA